MRLHRSPFLRRQRRLCVALASCALAVSATAQLAEDLRFTLKGTQQAEHYGFSIARIADVDGDGTRDFAVGAFGAKHKGIAGAGCVTVYSAKTRKVLRVIGGSKKGQGFGFVVNDIGDVDKDGRSDFAVGTAHERQQNYPGSVTVYSGRGFKVLHALKGTQPDEYFGGAVDGLGDLDGDGHADFAVGALRTSLSGRSEAGSVLVYSGKSAKLLWRVFGDRAKDQLGVSVAGVGDLNGDKVPDVLAGAWGDDSFGVDAGLARLYSGKDGKLLRQHFGKGADDMLGNTLKNVGDVDGDGTPDYAIAAFRARRSTHQHIGEVQVFSGKSGKQLHVWNGLHWGDFFGVSVAGLGDLDRDGRPEIGVGAWGDRQNGNRAGVVRVFSGSSGKLLTQINGSSRDELGVAVAAAGDLNGDGWQEFFVGAYEGYRSQIGYLQAWSLQPRTFAADRQRLSLASGGIQRLSISAGNKQARKLYIVVGSASGTSPGIVVGSGAIPVNNDFYHLYLLTNPNGLVQGSVGLLDGQGRGQAAFVLPKGMPGTLAGVRLYHAVLVLEVNGPLREVSNPVLVELVK